MVGHLRHIDEDLAKRVADGPGARQQLPEAPAAAAPVQDLEPSPALQIIGKMKDTLEGRQIGILIADGSDGAADGRVAAGRDAGRRHREDRRAQGGRREARRWPSLAADGQLAGTPSVLFDAVAVILSDGGRRAAQCRERRDRLRPRCLRSSQGDRRRRGRRGAAERRGCRARRGVVDAARPRRTSSPRPRRASGSARPGCVRWPEVEGRTRGSPRVRPVGAEPDDGAGGCRPRRVRGISGRAG